MWDLETINKMNTNKAARKRASYARALNNVKPKNIRNRHARIRKILRGKKSH